MDTRESQAWFEAQVVKAQTWEQKALVRWCQAERSLRYGTLNVIVPWVPAPLAEQLGATAITADATLAELVRVELGAIDEVDLHPARRRMGLLFVGLGALSLLFLWLYLHTRHPHWPLPQLLRQYWYPYIATVSLGVAGLFMLGREALRRSLQEILAADPQPSARRPHRPGKGG